MKLFSITINGDLCKSVKAPTAKDAASVFAASAENGEVITATANGRSFSFAKGALGLVAA